MPDLACNVRHGMAFYILREIEEKHYMLKTARLQFDLMNLNVSIFEAS